MIRKAALLLAGLLICGCAVAPQESERAVLIKGRILFRDPDEQQPKWACPKSTNPETETICLRYPNAYTADVRDVLIGRHVPRRLHVILWIHSDPPEDIDLYFAGTRQPSGEIEAFSWGELKYVGCDLADAAERLYVVEEVKAFQQANKLSCPGS